jgi:hypothetical protein
MYNIGCLSLGHYLFETCPLKKTSNGSVGVVSGGLGISLHIARSEYGGMMGFDLATSLAVGLDLVLTIWTLN